MTFQPKVNKKSAKMAILKNQNSDSYIEPPPTNVVDRLYKDAADRIEKTMNYNESVHEQMNKDYTFHPSISKSSNYISEHSKLFNGNNKDFYERQEQFL